VSGETATLDTGTPELVARVDGRVAVLTLNRPQARNALSDMKQNLDLALRADLPTGHRHHLDDSPF
jgi:hypothetical protein